MRVGMEDLPLFDVTQVGHDIGFSVVVPGTPYTNVRYSGLVAEGMMQLSSLDEGRGVYTLQARRANEGAIPAAGPSPIQPASLAPRAGGTTADPAASAVTALRASHPAIGSGTAERRR